MTQCDLDLDLYSPDAVGASDDCGASGAFVTFDDPAAADPTASAMNRINLRAENIHMPTNGTIVAFAGTTSQIQLRQSDCKQETGATNTSFIRLNPTVVQNFGGNLVHGDIHGDNGGVPFVDVGVDVFQGNNRIEGTKRYRGRNVRLNSGVQKCFVALKGGYSTSDQLGVIDNSGNTTNTILDYYNYPGTGVPPAAVQSVTSGATFTPNTDLYAKGKITAQAGAFTIANPSGTPQPMQSYILRVKDSGAARAITWGSQYRGVGVTLPTTTVAGKTFYLGFVWNSDDTFWDVIAAAQQA